MSDITLEDFRAEVTAFLDANAEIKEEATQFVWGEGSDEVALFEEIDETAEAAALVARRRGGQRYDAGPAGSAGPPSSATQLPDLRPPLQHARVAVFHPTRAISASAWAWPHHQRARRR
jgi:hypothetical protein